jgi:hypothetical protein
MRRFNAFKLKSKRIEYTDKIKAAVLDPNIRGLKIHLNGGWDWIDDRYGFIKLLLSRGQVSEITTHQDLLSKTDYLEAMSLGVNRSMGRLSVNFTVGEGKGAFASEKRINQAIERFQQFKQSKGA